MTKEEAIKALRTSPVLFVAYSRATNMPFVTCDEESFNDQVWIFARDEDLKEFASKEAESKILVAGMKYERKSFPQLYGLLHSIGINSIVYQDGVSSLEVELDDIAKQQDLSKLPPEKRPLFNPTLQLSGAYFMQEVRKAIPQDQKKNLREMEEEVLANLIRSEFILPVIPDAKDPKKLAMAGVKTKDGKTMQPLFSDVIEFNKFTRGQKMGMIKVPFEKVPQMSIKTADGFVLNPMGYNLILDNNNFNRLLEIKKKQKETPEN